MNFSVGQIFRDLNENNSILENPQVDDAILFCMFMGFNRGPSGRYFVKLDNISKRCLPKDMKFHCSWDWLMPIIERIEQSCLDDEGTPNVFQINLNSATIKPGIRNFRLIKFTAETKIRAAIEASCEFIMLTAGKIVEPNRVPKNPVTL